MPTNRKENKMNIFKVEKNFKVSTPTHVDLNDTNQVKEFLTSHTPQEGYGYCFSSFNDNLLTKDNFVSTSALLLDFNGRMNKSEIDEILTAVDIKAMLISSKGHFSYATHTAKPHYHLILSLKSPIEDKEIFKNLYSSVSRLFKNAPNQYMNSVDRYFIYSPENADIVSYMGKSQHIDEVDLSLHLSDNQPFYAMSPLRYSGKKKDFTTYQIMNPRNLEVYDLNNQPFDLFSGRTGEIYCPFHNNTAAHPAKVSTKKDKIEIECADHRQIFFFADDDIPRTPEQEVYNSDIDDFEKKGYIVGQLCEKNETFFIKAPGESKIAVFVENSFKTAVNILYKRLYPKNTMSGYSYFSKIKKYKNLFAITDSPKQRHISYQNAYITDLNLFSGYPLRKPLKDSYNEIYVYLAEHGWRSTLQKYVPYTSLLLHNLMRSDFEIEGLYWFINWLVGIFVYLEKAPTSVIFHSNAKSGYHILFDYIITPLFGKDRVIQVLQSMHSASDNSYLEAKTIISVSEPSFCRKDSYDMVRNITSWTSSKDVTIVRNRQPSYTLQNNCNFIWNVTSNLPSGFSQNDATFSVFKSFTAISSLRGPDGNLLSEEILRNKLSAELKHFSQILLAWDFDSKKFSQVYHSSLRDMMLERDSSALYELLFDLVNFTSPSDLVGENHRDAPDLYKRIADIYKNPEQRFIPSAILTEIYNARTGEGITTNKLSRNIKLLIETETVTTRIDSKNKPTKGYYIKDIESGLNTLKGKALSKNGIDYKPLTNRIFDTTNRAPQQDISFTGLHQFSTTEQMLFSSRPIYTLEVKGLEFTNPANYDKISADMYLCAADRDEHLFLKSEFEALKPYIIAYGDDESLDLTPLERRIPLEREDMDQFFVKSEADHLSRYLQASFSLTASIIPPKDIVLGSKYASERDIPRSQATRIMLNLKDLHLADFNLHLYIVCDGQNVGIQNYSCDLLTKLLLNSTQTITNFSMSTMYR